MDNVTRSLTSPRIYKVQDILLVRDLPTVEGRVFFSFIVGSAKSDLPYNEEAIYIHRINETYNIWMKLYFSSKIVYIHPN